jgi:hypothetical protein
MTDNPGREPATRRDEIVNTWNERVPVGSPVRYWRGWRKGEGQVGRTRTTAQRLPSGEPVVWIDNTSGCLSVAFVEPITEDEYAEAARTSVPAAPSATQTPDGDLLPYIALDDPRVLALAKARQQIEHENPFDVGIPTWDGLNEDDQERWRPATLWQRIRHRHPA